MRGLTRDTLVYGVGGSAARIISIVFVPIYTRVFTPDDYGALDLLTTQISILTILAMVGLNTAVFYHYRRIDEIEERRRLVGTALAMAGVAALAICGIGLLFAGDLAELVLGERRYAAAVAASFVWLPVNVAGTLVLDLLRLEFRPVAFTVIGIGRSLLASALGVTLVIWAGLGVEAVLVSQAAMGVVGLVIGLWLSREAWLPALDRAIAGRLLAIGLPMIPASLFTWLMTYSDRFFLVQFRDIGEVGIYAIANRLAALLTLLIVAFETAWYPFAYASARDPEHRAFFARVLTYVVLVTLPLAAGLGLLAREALLVLTTSEYVPAYPYVGLLALGLVANSAVQIFVVGVQLSGRTWLVAASAAGAAVLNLALNLALIPPLGVLGAALATLAGFLAWASLLWLIGSRAYPIPYRFGRIGTMTLVVVLGLAAGVALDSTVPAAEWDPPVTLLKLLTFAAIAAIAVWLLDFAPVRLAREIARRTRRARA